MVQSVSLLMGAVFNLISLKGGVHAAVKCDKEKRAVNAEAALTRIVGFQMGLFLVMYGYSSFYIRRSKRFWAFGWSRRLGIHTVCLANLNCST